MTRAAPVHLDGVTAVLCDADGTLFASEEPAFAASAVITRELARRYRLSGDFSPTALRRAAAGRNFRDALSSRLAAAGVSVDPAEFEEWVQREKQAVTERLARTLVVEPKVSQSIKNWAQRCRLALVSSSATSRLDACLAATGLAEYFPKPLRFSAEDSLARPMSKPDPAVYRHALARLGCAADDAVAIEDSVSGAQSAVGAGIRTLGIVQFAPADEQGRLTASLRVAGALAVADSWAELAGWL
jgi:beta-phosphoglucomutase-like phosphatase (HAD superfamily)